MFTKDNTTLVVQGNVYQHFTEEFLTSYASTLPNVIFSTWENETIPQSICTVLKNKLPDNPSLANINLQLKSSLEGCKLSKTPYTIKIRSDIFMKDIESWLEFFSHNHQENRLFVLGLSNVYWFSPRDHMWAGRTEDLIKLFDIAPMTPPYDSAPPITSMYPELYLGLSYYANFSDKAKQFLQDYQTYALINSPRREEMREEWEKIGTKYLYPVPRSLKYYWPKYFLNREYNYDETAQHYGEFWHDDIIKTK